MSTWLINDESPEFYGLTVTGGQFRSAGVSHVRLSAGIKFDAEEKFAYGEAITIKRDSDVFFRGKVRAIPKTGSPDSEGHDYLVEDAWADLERLTYQEPWLIRQSDYTGVAYLPKAVLGMNSSGTRIGVGAQIREVLAFAIARGVSIVAGSIPDGMLLWPSEVTSVTCADVIRQSLRYNPDWIPWIDHTTTVPTLNVTTRAAAAARSLAVTDCQSLAVTKTQDRIPSGVRIVFETASMIDSEVYRSIAVDQYPTVSTEALVAPAGIGIISTTVELAGMKVQIEKQQVQVRELPTTSADAHAYLKLKFPVIKDIADSKIDISAWTTVVIPETETEASVIDSKLPRIPGSTRSELPNELVKGVIREGMQRKVGKVLVEMTVTADSTATDEEAAKIAKLPSYFVVNATNAVTKTYSIISAYTGGESVPTGIAQAFYNALQSGCYFDGSVTIAGSELSAVRWHGSKIHLTGSDNTEWATMGAPVHTVDWDLKTCETTIGFGPNPEYAIQDFVEFLRQLSRRENTEYTVAERTGEKIGTEDGISAAGDSVGPYDVPETVVGGSSGGNLNLKVKQALEGTDGWSEGYDIFWLVWRDGVFVGRKDSEPTDTPAGLITQNVTETLLMS